jgi:hypothetical protein
VIFLLDKSNWSSPLILDESRESFVVNPCFINAVLKLWSGIGIRFCEKT